MRIQFTDFEHYFSQFSPEIVEKLASIRSLVHETVPEAEEVISYDMPAFKYRKRILIYFAAFKKHIGFYALPSGKDAFLDRLSEYKTSKGTVQFPYDKPLPLDLIREMVVYRMNELDLKSNKK